MSIACWHPWHTTRHCRQNNVNMTTDIYGPCRSSFYVILSTMSRRVSGLPTMTGSVARPRQQCRRKGCSDSCTHWLRWPWRWRAMVNNRCRMVVNTLCLEVDRVAFCAPEMSHRVSRETMTRTQFQLSLASNRRTRTTCNYYLLIELKWKRKSVWHNGVTWLLLMRTASQDRAKHVYFLEKRSSPEIEKNTKLHEMI